MADYPFVLHLSEVVSASSTATLDYQVPTNQTLKIHSIVFEATGAFTLIGIRNSTGRNFTNASQAAGIPSTNLQDGQTAYLSLRDFVIPIEVRPGETIYFDLLDTSAASNTVQFDCNCVKSES